MDSASSRLAVEHLRAVDAGHLGQAVLVQAHQHAAGDAVDLGHPVLQIGVLPLTDGSCGIALGGDILPAGHVGLYAQKTGNLLHLQGHLQIDLGLGGTVRCHCSGIEAAVARVDDQNQSAALAQGEIL